MKPIRTLFSSRYWGMILLFFVFVACHKKDADAPAPVLSSFAPAQGSPGGTVVLTGQHFSTDKTKDVVKINGVDAVVTAASATEISATIPETTTGKITLTIDGITLTSATDFTVVPNAPTISSLNVDRGITGTGVVITGTNFTAESKVYFGGVMATDVTVNSKTQITAKVPTGALTGKVKVTANAMETVSRYDFYAAPTISLVTPDHAGVGDVVTITGTNFNATPTENTAKIGDGLVTEIVHATATELQVKVPTTATTGNITVTVKTLTVLATTAFTLTPPAITSFLPSHGGEGSEMTISGTGFLPGPVVNIGSKVATVIASTPTSIRVTIPSDMIDPTATSNSFPVTVGYGTMVYTTNSRFEVTDIWIKRSTGFGPNKVYNEGVTFVINNKVYMGLGRNTNGTGEVNVDMMAFDPLTYIWSSASNIPTSMKGRLYPFVSTMGAKVYVGTGRTLTPLRDLNDLWEIEASPAGDLIWTQKASNSLLPNGYNSGIAFSLNNLLYAGVYSGNSQMYSYNPSADEWTPSFSTANAGSRYSCAGFAINNIGYFGGGNSSAGPQKTFYKYDRAVDLNLASPIAPLPENSNSNVSCSLNGKGYALDINQVLYEYSPDNNSWTRRKSLSPEIFYLAYMQVVNNHIFSFSIDGTSYEYIPNR